MLSVDILVYLSFMDHALSHGRLYTYTFELPVIELVLTPFASSSCLFHLLDCCSLEERDIFPGLQTFALREHFQV